MESVDDSDGELGGVLADAQLTRAQACRQGDLDPAELALRLATWALQKRLGGLPGESPTTHAEALGTVGLDRFESLVDEYFERLPRLSADEEDEDDEQDEDDSPGPSRFTVTNLKEQLARRRGTDALVEVLARRPVGAYRYLQTARSGRGRARRRSSASGWNVPTVS